jgi:hypothetical protein
MKLLLFSDPHINPKAEFSKPTEDGLTDYLHRVEKSFDWICEQIATHDPGVVACLGDMFETTGYVDTQSLKVATDVFQQLSGVCQANDSLLIFLVGNHDSYSVVNNLHNLEFLSLEKPGNVLVVDTPRMVTHKKCKFFCIPWTDGCDFEIPHDAGAILCHLDVQGGLLFKDKKTADFGIDPSEFKVPTFNGHQHNPSEVASNFWNVGALLSRNFQDVDSPARGAMVVELGNSSRVSGFEEFYTVKRLENPHDTPFKDVNITCDGSASIWKERIELGETGLDNFFVRIRHSEEYSKIAEQLGYLTMGCRVEPLPRDTPITKTEFVNEAFSPEENFKQYVDQVFLFDQDGDRERILELGYQHIKKAKRDRTNHAQPIKFESLDIQNFQSLGNVSMEFEPGLVYVQGRNEDDPADSNGSGKSSLCEALYWCLTGKSLRGYIADEVIQWGQKSCCVSCVVQIGDHGYKILRQRGPYKVGLFLYASLDSEFRDISCRKNDDTDREIKKLIGRSKEVLQHSIFLTSDLSTRFTALSFPDRIRLIEQVTDSEIYTEVGKSLNKDYLKVSAELSELGGQIEALGKVANELWQRKLELDGEMVEVHRSQQSSLSGLKVELLAIIKKKAEIEAKIEAIEIRILTKRQSSKNLAHKLEEMNGKVIVMNTDRVRLNTEISHQSQLLDEIRQCIERGECLTCGQVISETSPIVQQASSIGQKINELTATLAPIDQEYDRLKQRLDQLSDRIGHFDAEALGLGGQKLTLNQEVGQLDVEAENNKKAMRSIRNKAVDLEARRDEVRKQIDYNIEHVAALREELRVKDRELYAIEWLCNAFSTKGIRAKMLSTVTVPFVNSRLQSSSAKLGLPCQLTTQTETKGGKIEDKIDVVLTGHRTYKGCSRGERRKIDLAIQCGFKDLARATGGSHVNLLICDEVIDPLDDTGTHAFFEMLREESEDMTTLIMSHKKFLSPFTDREYTLVKKDGVADLEVN